MKPGDDIYKYHTDPNSWLARVGIQSFLSGDDNIRHINLNDSLNIADEEYDLLLLWIHNENIGPSISVDFGDPEKVNDYIILMDEYLNWFFIRKEYNYSKEL